MKLPQLFCLLVLLGSSFAPAQVSAEDMEQTKARAKALTAEGQELLSGERFLEAAAKFRQAYVLVPHPVLLYNQAICHRLAGNRHTARRYYRKYLAVQSDEELAALSRKFIAELDESIAADPTADPNPEVSEGPPKKEPLNTTKLPADTPTVADPKPANGSSVVAGTTGGPARQRHMTPATWALGGVSLVALGLGSYFAISGYSDYNDCESRGTCETDAEVDDIDTKLLLGDVLIGVSLASAVAAGVLYYLSEEDVPAVGVSASESSATVHYRLDF